MRQTDNRFTANRKAFFLHFTTQRQHHNSDQHLHFPANAGRNRFLPLVGYNTVTLQPGYNMLSVNFKDVGNTEGIEIDKVFPGGGVPSNLQPGTGAASADKVMVYVNDNNGGGDYVTYFLYKAAKTNAKDYWWVDGNLNKSGLKFKNGDSFWFYKRGDETVTATISGEVELAATKSVDLMKGYNMIGNFFPTGLVLNDEIYTKEFWQGSGAQPGTGAASADKVMVYVNDGNKSGDYVTYFLYKAAKTNAKDYTWVDGNLNQINTSVAEPGQGVWYYHRGKGMTLPLHMPAAK